MNLKKGLELTRWEQTKAESGASGSHHEKNGHNVLWWLQRIKEAC